MTAELTAPDLVVEAIHKDDATLSDVLKLVLGISQPRSTVVPPLPESVTLNPEIVQTLKSLVSTLQNLNLPERRRELTDAEKEDFTVAFIETGDVTDALDAAKDALKKVFQNHFDVVALSSGKVGPETRVNKDGYYVLPDKESAAVKDLSKKVTRSVTEPSPVLTDAGLQELERQKLITHKEYLAATRQTREVDERGVMKLIESRPGLLPHLASVSKPTKDPYNQIRLSPNKS